MKRRGTPEINLDALTDIIANSIGVLLFILLFAVLSSRSTFYNFYVPSTMNPDDRTRAYVPIAEETSKQRVNFLCTGGTVSVLDFSRLYNDLVEGLPALTYDNFENVVALLNSRRAEYNGLTARIHAVMGTRKTGGRTSKFYRELTLVVNRSDSFAGEGLNAVASGNSRFSRELNRLDPGVHWICFYVENDSIEIFRKARELAWAKDFDTGWEPVVITWPQVFDLTAQSGRAGTWNLAPNLNQGR